MKSQARVVIIGGGVVGCSALYHLAKRGWTDAVLVEMDELTSGSTWHAAGNIPTFSGTRNMIKLQHYSTELYKELAVDPEYPINYHQTGSIRLAQDQSRMEEFHHVSAMANAMGIEYEMLDLAEMKKRNPFLETHDLQGALWDPHDGDIDPSQLTQALAAKSRKMGAEINRFTKVIGIERLPNNEWNVKTDKGDIQCEYVINAGGYRGAEVGDLAGKFLPLVSMEHQYLVTESVPELESHDGLIPLVRDPDDSYYLRQEKTGLILGPYEWRATPHWADGKLPENFAYELYPDDLERLEWYIEQACARMPILGTVGVQKVINGPIPYSPDGNPYVGPAFGLTNFFHCCGFSFGICQGGGAGKSIAEWVIDGQPEWDLWSLDPRRYTEYANQKYVVDRATELYQNEYAIHFPEDEWPAGRPALTTPTYDRLAAKGAQMGARGGWERATFFPEGGAVDMPEKGSFHRKPYFDTVAAECKHVREKVGLLDLGGFSKYELKGDGAADWLDTLIAGNLPKVGRLTLSYFCTPKGGLWSEMTITRLADNHFLLVTAAAAKWHDYQWLVDHMPDSHSMELSDITDKLGTLVVAGPQSRSVMQKLSNHDFSNDAFKWLSCQELVLEGADVIALRVNYVGELGWELHVPVEKQVALYDALMEAGSEFEIRDFGMYAMESMRLEKCYRAWKAELDHEYSPLRSGLSRFVNLDKADFIGKQALLDEVANGLPDLFVPFVLDDDTCDAVYGCPVSIDGEVVGYTTSGGYGHCVEKSIALGYIRTDLAKAGTKVQINVFGKMRNAEIVDEPIYDPKNEKLRS